MCKHDGGFDIVKTKTGEIRDAICSDCGTPLLMIISDQQDRIEELETAGLEVGRLLRQTDPLTVPIKISSAIINLVGIAEEGGKQG